MDLSNSSIVSRESLSNLDRRTVQVPTALSDPVTDRRTLLAVSGGLLAGGTAGCLEDNTGTPTASPADPASPTTVRRTIPTDLNDAEIGVRDHGLANPGITVRWLGVHEGRAYVPSRRGNPLRVGAFDLDAEEVTSNYEISPGIQSFGVEGHEQYVYFGTQDGGVFRLDTDTDEMSMLADVGSWVFGLAVAPDGTVYVGSDAARVYEIDPESGETTDHGRMAEEKYAYDVFATPETVYVGVGNTGGSGIYTIDRDSGDVKQLFAEGITDFIKKFDVNESYIVCHGNYDRSFVLERESIEGGLVTEYQEVTPLPGVFGVSQREENLVYYVALPESAAEFPEGHVAHGVEQPVMCTYDVRAEEHERRFELPTAIAEEGLQYRSTVLDGNRFVGVQGTPSGNIVVIDVEAGETNVYDLESAGMNPTPAANQSTGRFRGQPVTSRNGALFVYDLGGDSYEKLDIGGEPKRQVEVDDDLYVGTYTGADFWVYDGTDLRHLDSAEGQGRPLDLVHHESTRSVVMGTQPNYGAETGGAVAMLDLESESVSTYGNVVPDQSIRGVASAGDRLFVGTSTRRGQGTEPVTDEAQVGEFDPDAGEVIWTTVPAAGKSRVITLAARNGATFGIANSPGSGSVFFVVDTDAETVEGTVDVDVTTRLQEGPDGRYYGVASSPLPPSPAYDATAGGLVVYNPGQNRFTRFHTDEKVFAFLGESAVVDDAIYYVDAASWQLRSIPDLASY
jgi:outer membrane protein assembly factor BamB